MKKPSTKTGLQIIGDIVKILPGLPGVYRMLDGAENTLYIGKARRLNTRVRSYTHPEKQSLRIQRMIEQTARMEFTTTHTETEALLLEANLIKKLKPRYNILLRDDKSFPYILITADHDFPLVTKHRGAKDRKGEYFGPFASGSAVNETLALLHKIFLLRNCPDSVFAARTRPCLQYQIKRCTAPCVQKVSREEYAQQVDMARQFLSGKSRKIQEHFVRDMQKASEATDFETAALFRDRIRALTHIQSNKGTRFDGDIHVIHQHSGLSCIEVFFFRGGQNFGNRSYFPRHEKDEKAEDVLASFIAQFYADKPAPKEILINIDIPDRVLLGKALGASVLKPLRGPKKELIAMALKNAKASLDRKRAADAGQEENLESLAAAFGLDAPPQRIEVYDNSHVSGTHAIGAMIVAGPEGFQKNAYRKFNMAIKTGDDFAMMREMLTRRFSSTSLSPSVMLAPARASGRPSGRHITNETRGHATGSPRKAGMTSLAIYPDLLLIDGGQGQLNAALKVMADLGISDIPVAAIAKGPDRNAGRERFFLPGKAPFSLESNAPLLYFLQRLRDEAHRFAITSHRARRSKAIVSSPLDDIPGIGGKRKKALLLHFGSAKAVAEAGLVDLQKVDTISDAIAKKIYNFFHEEP